jgi:hypothetical protein
MNAKQVLAHFRKRPDLAMQQFISSFRELPLQDRQELLAYMCLHLANQTQALEQQIGLNQFDRLFAEMREKGKPS